GKAFYAGSRNFSFAGDLHASRLAIDLGDFHVRDATAVGGMRLEPENLRLSRLALRTNVNPPSAPKGRMVRVDARIASAVYGLATDDLALGGVALSTLNGMFEGSARFHRFETFHTEGVITGFDARTVLAIYSPQQVPWDGLISGPVTIAGSLARNGGIAATA